MTAATLAECFRPADSDVRVLRRLLAYVVALLAYPIRRYRQIALEYRLLRLACDARRAAALSYSAPSLPMPSLPVAAPADEAAVLSPFSVLADSLLPIESQVTTDDAAPAPRTWPLPLIEAPSAPVADATADADVLFEPVNLPAPPAGRKPRRKAKTAVVAATAANAPAERGLTLKQARELTPGERLSSGDGEWLFMRVQRQGARGPFVVVCRGDEGEERRFRPSALRPAPAPTKGRKRAKAK